MIRAALIGLTAILLSGCVESFERIDPVDFNEKIGDRTDIETPEGLIKIYYDWPENEETSKLTLETKKPKDNRHEIKLIHDRLEDDSLRAEQIILTAQKRDMTWSVLEIKRNLKCWEGRGHRGWGREYCN